MRRWWECHVRVNNNINNFNNEGMLIVPLFFAILLFFPRDQNISKQSLNNKHEEITALNNTFTCQQCLIRLEVKRMGREQEYKLENY